MVAVIHFSQVTKMQESYVWMYRTLILKKGGMCDKHLLAYHTNVFMGIQNLTKWNDPKITDEQWDDLLCSVNEPLVPICNAECERIGNIDQPSQKEQYEQLYRFLHAYNDLADLEKERQKRIFYQYLFDCGLKRTDCRFSYEEISQMWKEHFLNGISKEQLADCPLDQYLWNVFTYDIITNYKIGTEAKQEFNKADKNDIYVFNASSVYHLSMPDNITASMFRFLYGKDIYFVDGNFQWTFILKHEDSYEPIWYAN